jgi:hypothetical protein
MISYYNGNIKDSICRGHVTLEQFVRANSKPLPKMLAIFDKIRQAELDGDKQLKMRLKENLYSFTPGVTIPKGQSRKYDNIAGFTGLMQLDFDNEPLGNDLKDWLFNDNPECICAYTSPSGVGVKALFKIPVVKTVDEYQEYFLGVEEYMENCGIDSFDHAPYNCILPLFLSLDKDILYRDNALKWAKKCLKNDISTFANLQITAPTNTMPTGGEEFGSVEYYKRITIEIFTAKVDGIRADPGHPVLRDACLVLGSRVGAGYIDKGEAELLAQYAIRINGYLCRKKELGINNYIKTSKWGIQIGSTRPKFYK